MQDSLRGFGITVLTAWLVLCIAAFVYSQSRDIPNWVVFAVVPAFLVEVALYLAAGFASVRLRLEHVEPFKVGSLATLSAPLPYLIYSIGTGVFDLRSLAAILAGAALVAYWFIVFDASPIADTLFLLTMASVVLLKDYTFKTLYPDPVPRLSLHVLGFMMWIRIGMIVLLSIRKLEGVSFGFMPSGRDWKIGARNFVLFLPVAYALALSLDFIRPQPNGITLKLLATAAATFFVTLWVLAAAEEMFFRGILQQLLTRTLSSDVAGLAIASVLFGLSHLGYNDFPNWRFAILATIAGAVYGLSFQQARSVRAAMVTHALVNTTWRVFLF